MHPAARLLEEGRLDEADNCCTSALDVARRESAQSTQANQCSECVQLLALLSRIKIARGATQEALEVAMEAVEQSTASMPTGTSDPPQPIRCEALLALGAALQAVEQHAEAMDALTAAEEAAANFTDTDLRARVLRRLGISCSVLGRHDRAIVILEEALTLVDRANPAELAHARFSLLNARSRAAETLAPNASRLASFAELYEQWKTFADEMDSAGLRRLMVMATGNAGIAARHAGLLDDALNILRRAIDLHANSGQRIHEAVTYHHLGAVLHSQGALQDAIAAYRTGLERLGDSSPREAMEANSALADVLEAANDPRAALAAYKTSRQWEKRLHDEDARIAAVRREERESVARLTKRWQVLAEEDPLTRLVNRRGFDRLFAQSVSKGNVALLLFDLDHFKQINDRFGHPIGDAVLQGFADTLREGQRASDTAARLGGEEFALVLTDVEPIAALDIAERIRARVAARNWHEIADGLAVTVSIGIAFQREVSSTAVAESALLSLADTRLYAAKMGGRNRIEPTR